MRLIDADALIKEVRENKELYEKERVYLEGLLLNAPTVPLPDFKGYKKAIIDGETNFSRQQGEWIKIGDIGLAYKCNICEHVDIIATRFCPNCGADMRGKK